MQFFYLNPTLLVQMTDKNDRIVPLISCMIFYIWFYVNIKNNPGIPVDYILFVLGATIGLSVSFIMTIFEKISINAIGVGGFLIYILTLIFHFGYEYAVFEIFGENYRTHIIFLFLVCIIVSGLILSFRLLLRTHSSIQIYLGLFAGIISQLLANRILL
jgi:hypothetical protein